VRGGAANSGKHGAYVHRMRPSRRADEKSASSSSAPDGGSAGADGNGSPVTASIHSLASRSALATSKAAVPEPC